jgi:hypothetical protein
MAGLLSESGKRRTVQQLGKVDALVGKILPARVHPDARVVGRMKSNGDVGRDAGACVTNVRTGSATSYPPKAKHAVPIDASASTVSGGGPVTFRTFNDDSIVFRPDNLVMAVWFTDAVAITDIGSSWTFHVYRCSF